jgi:hypothetical protein
MVEARGISDGFNLLAWPLLRAAGGTLLDIDGVPLAPQPFVPDTPCDYVAAGNAELAHAAVATIHRMRSRQQRCIDDIEGLLGV